jgi:NADH-quinone oxidoreductase subunit C
VEPLEIADKIKSQFAQAVEDIVLYQGQVSVIVKDESIFDICTYLKHEQDLYFDYLADLCGCDYSDREQRFEVVYNLRSLKYNYLVRLKVRLSEESPSVQSVSALWASALWFEREAHDMFGIYFTNHPDLRRLLMPGDWEGHPLRKDYPLKGPEDWKWQGLEKVEEMHKSDWKWVINAQRPD